MHEFIEQLRRRKVFRTVVAYLLLAAGTVELADIVVPRLGLPDWTVSFVVWLAVLGLPVAIWLGWAFDVRSAAADEGEKGGTATGRARAKAGSFTGPLIIAAVVSTGLFAALLLWRPWAGTPLVDELPGWRTRPLITGQVLDLHPSLSPDGSTLAFGRVEKGDMDIFVMGLEGEAVPLTDHPADDISPRYSPDGTRIAFFSDRGEGMDLYWISPTGGRERRIARTQIPLLDFGTVWFRGLGAQPWSPDGTRILFPRLDESGSVATWMVNLETGEERQITDPPPGALDQGAAWAPDGRRVIFDRTRDGIASLMIVPDVGAAEPRVEKLSQADVHDFGAVWLPDGSGIVFASDRSGGLSVWAAEVDNIQAGSPLPSPARWVYHLTVGPDGSLVMATAEHHADLYLGTRDAPEELHRNVTRTSTNDFGAVFKDSNEVVYHSDRTGNYDLWTYRIDQDIHLPLTEDPAFDAMPHVSPDGHVVFASDRGGELELWVLRAGAENPEKLLDRAVSMSCDRLTVYCRGPRWSPDGTLIGVMLAGAAGPELWVVAPDGTGARRLELEGVLSFDWYLDGRRLVYARAASGREVEVRARDIGSGVDRLLLSGFHGEPSVSASGEWLALVTSQSHYRMDAMGFRLQVPRAGGLPEVLEGPVPLTEGQGVWHTHNFAWAPDGEGFAYTRDTDRGDLHILEAPRRP